MKDLASRSLLIVDDDPTWRMLLSISLRDAGFEVRTAKHAEDALQLLEVLAPAALIVDLNPPGLDGFTVLEWNAEQPHPFPAVALTAQRSETLLERCRQLGVARALGKPLKARQLVECVREVSGADPG